MSPGVASCIHAMMRRAHIYAYMMTRVRGKRTELAAIRGTKKWGWYLAGDFRAA